MNAAVSPAIAQAIHAHDRHGALNAYFHWTTPQLPPLPAKTVPLPPLHDWPVAIKDHFGVTGWPTYAGTCQRLPAPWEVDGPVIAKLRDCGAVLMGKTIAVELAFGGLGVNRHWGSPRNPWDAKVHRVAGGSTSGGGVSLWEGSARLALGTDPGGSVRIPASFTGTVGLKLTQGRLPLTGVVPLSPTLDSIGFLTRTVADAATAFTALLDEPVPPLPRPPRIGVMSGLPWQDLEADIGSQLEQQLARLALHRATLVTVAVPEAVTAFELLQLGSVVAAECDEFIDALLPDWRPKLDQFITARLADGGDINAREYLRRQRRIAQMQREMAAYFAAVDVLVCPTVPLSPPRLAAVNQPHKYRWANLLSLRNTCLANFGGLCALSLPAGLDSTGLPVGLQLLAPARQEAQLLAVAAWIEVQWGTMAQQVGYPPLLNGG